MQHGEFEQIRKALEPWVRSGRLSNADLTRLLTSHGTNSFLSMNPSRLAGIGGPLQDVRGSNIDKMFQTSPSYNFELQQGAQAIQDAGSGTTGAISGNTLKALQGYGTGLAGQDFWNWYNAQNSQYWNQYNAASNRQNSIYNMLTGLSGQGLGAATQTGQFGQAAVSNIGNDIMSGAAAGAAGTVGAANAITGGLSSLGNAAMLQSLFANPNAATSGGFMFPGTNTPFGGASASGDATSYF
ncbi:MAG TPA: hypothetical protein VGR45_02130 [Stellaceae bacterium]|nr:hypothetical protein [Stellaceae bacterium]